MTSTSLKKISIKAAVCFAAAVLTVNVNAQGTYVPSPENIASRQELDEARFGIFIHWGIYAMLGQGEWVMEVEKLPYSEYSRLMDGFYPSKFNADEWVSAFKSSGARYMTITSRHHDGFSMFDTKASDYKVTNTPFGRDVLKEIADACHRQNFRLHFYYSHADWGREDYYPLGESGHSSGRNPVQPEGSWEHYKQFMDQQLTELLTNYGELGAIWFDGVWDKEDNSRDEQPELWGLYHQYDLIHSLQPGCLVGNNHHLDPFDGEDIQIFERDVPGQNEAGYSGTAGVSTTLALETCQTMNTSWGYKINDKWYKSVAELVNLLARTSGKGANLLLNIGPRPDGTLPDEAVERLHGIGEWLSVNGESIYGTKAGVTGEKEWGVSTKKGNALYLHVLDKAETIVLDSPDGKHPLGAKVLSASLLDGGTAVPFSVDKKTGLITVSVPEIDMTKGDTVIKLVFKNEI